jgi:hypothetical protein
VIHGPDDCLARRITGIKETLHRKDCVCWNEKILPMGDTFTAFEGDEIIARYNGDGKGCIVRSGTVYAFGFQYGYSYTSKGIPHVPVEQKNNALYPVPLMAEDILHSVLYRYIKPPVPIIGKGLETAVFDNGIIMVNHTSYTVSLEAVTGEKLFQQPVENDILMPRSAVFIY